MKKKYFIIILLLLLVLFFILFIFLNNTFPNKNNVIEKVCDYNNPIIPNGFKKVETDLASWELENNIPVGWNNGLVIEDSIGNQFVWVPIDGTNVKYDASMSDYRSNYIIPKDVEYQIKKYGGFYISRYEAGVPKELQENIKNIGIETNDIIGIPMSIKGIRIWNYISAENAKKSAENMYHNENINSGLITNYHWDLTIKWIENEGYDVKNNSFNWGNYSNVNFKFSGLYSIDHGKNYSYTSNKLKSEYNMILSSGATDRNCCKNIYDLAGNVSELVEEDNGKYSSRGGYYDNISFYAANSTIEYNGASNKLGYRIVLYLK